MSDDDLRKQMMFDSEKKSTGVAYLLWFFLGGLGVHRFYLGQTGTGLAQLGLQITGWLTFWFFLGFLFWGILGIWWIVDAFLLPNMITEENKKLTDSILGGPSTIDQPRAPARIVE